MNRYDRRKSSQRPRKPPSWKLPSPKCRGCGQPLKKTHNSYWCGKRKGLW